MTFPLPIVSLGNVLSLFVSAFIAWKLYSSYRTSRSGEIRSFFLVFASLAVFFFFAAAPGLLSTNPVLLGIFNVLTMPFAHLGAYFFTIIPLTLYQTKRLKLGYIAVFWTTFAAATTLRILGFGPLQEMPQGNFVFWLRPNNPFMELSFIVSGVLLFLSIAIASSVFTLYALRNRDNPFLFLRSLILGAGSGLLGVVSAINFIVGATPNIGAQAGASLFAVVALLVIALGVFLKPRPA